MSEQVTTDRIASTDGLSPLLVEADMESLAAVAHQAGIDGIDLKALARVLDAAQRVAVSAERERCAKAAEDFLTRGRSPLGRAVADAIRSQP